MNNAEFYLRTEEFFREQMKVMQSKGSEYSGSDDKFANFKRLANMQGISVESIWLTYFTKHFDSLVSFIRRINKGESIADIESTLSEPISGRIGDMINYLFILKGIIDEQREEEKQALKARGVNNGKNQEIRANPEEEKESYSGC